MVHQELQILVWLDQDNDNPDFDRPSYRNTESHRLHLRKGEMSALQL